MALEDHAGDITRKARASARVSRETAAGAAGLTVAEFTVFEETGQAAHPVNWRALATSLGLAGDRLEAIAAGWEPAPVDLSRWRGLRRFTTVQAENAVHAYLVWDPNTHQAAMFDTGWDATPALAEISKHRLDLRQVFLTHDHTDHRSGWPAIQARFPEASLFALKAHSHGGPAVIPDEFQLGALTIQVRATPGHSPDGATYVVRGFPETPPAVAIVGDSLMAGSHGWGFQSDSLLRESVWKMILTLPAETLVCPGHGPMTTIGAELAHNPFFA